MYGNFARVEPGSFNAGALSPSAEHWFHSEVTMGQVGFHFIGIAAQFVADGAQWRMPINSARGVVK